MKRKIWLFYLLLIPLIGNSQLQMKVNPSVTDAMYSSEPSHVKIYGYLGGRMDDCIRERVTGQDVEHLLNPFFVKTESHLWQSEFLGKWMLGAILSYRYNNDPVLYKMIREGAEGLIRSQLPNGYIGNYAEDAYLKSWDIWGRKYSLLALLSYYDLTGDKKVLDACCRAADHLMTQVGPGKVDIATTGNYMGMASCSILEPVVFLYVRTGEEKYLDFAKYIVKQIETPQGSQLISKALAGLPVANRTPHSEAWFGTDNGQKAYEMMSCYEGILELYKITKDPIYLSAVEKTVNNIIEDEINIAGSGSSIECWYHGKTLQTIPTYRTMETCVTMTWMKLNQTLLRLTGNPVYADQIEITAYNALLASMKDDASQIAKYSPLEGLRHPGEEQCGMHINCCNANGSRAFALLPEYAVMTDENTVYINLYNEMETTAALRTKKKNKVKIVQQTDYPVSGQITIKVDDLVHPDNFTVALRIPFWSKTNAVAVNGEEFTGILPGSYFRINRNWQKGDVIHLTLDTRGRMVQQDNHFALMKGPVVLSRDTRFHDGFVDETAQVIHTENYVELKPVSGKPPGIWMAFTAPLILGTDLEGDDKHPKQVHFCDFSSAGNTWKRDIRYKVWLPETLNVRRSEYKPY